MNENFIENYITSAPKDVQSKLRTIHQLIHLHIPNLIETSAYQMPTYKRKQNMIHFAVYKNHIGIYPGPVGINYLRTLQDGLLLSKGAWRLAIEDELPMDVFVKLLQFLDKHYS
jgi:uncharacterized protein YdhG (YjbR/CyaY superfamily)